MVGCHGTRDDVQQPRLMDAIIAFPPRDTARLSLPVTTHGCANRRMLLIEAIIPEGTGVLVRLQYRDSLVPGSYKIALPGDTTAPGAVVAVRYLLRDVSHGFSFDSGAVELTREGQRIGGHIRGTGIESGIRTPSRIDFHDVPLPSQTDTVSCALEP